jgi:HPt (histidine-containing phosphotransfer) domain-containing protein
VTAAVCAPILDADAFAGVAALGDDLVTEVVEIFCEDLPPRLAAIRTALAGGDLATVERVAHALAGSAGMIGARRLALVAAELEAAAADGRATTAAAARLLDEAAAAVALLRERISGGDTTCPRAS